MNGIVWSDVGTVVKRDHAEISHSIDCQDWGGEVGRVPELETTIEDEQTVCLTRSLVGSDTMNIREGNVRSCPFPSLYAQLGKDDV